ncbi:MAG TPA: polysaccharide deacetylase family protein [Reyranella sp.]|nr:polysaccharide deacetylase family protein [Reyranella sp.]
MSGWQALAEEAAQWRDAGRTAELWWRDDDASDVTPALDHLLALRRETDWPVALAVIPARATTALAGRLAAERGVDVLQHGYSHTNHALPPDKKMELGPHRPAMLVLGDLGTGWMAMERLFGPRALPVMVPPWNRIAPAFVPALPEIGFRGLSTFAGRTCEEPVKGLRQINAHVDLIDWKGGRGFVGEEAALSALVAALRHSRTATGEPVGLLSHHLAMDEGAWDFLSMLLGSAKTTPGLGVSAAQTLFASREARV